jgi:hypothetical protein
MASDDADDHRECYEARAEDDRREYSEHEPSRIGRDVGEARSTFLLSLP